MTESLTVAWEAGTPFFRLVERLTAKRSWQWQGEPTEALGDVWKGLKKPFPTGHMIDPKERKLLATIVCRKVDSFFTRGEFRRKFHDRRDSVDQLEQPSRARARTSRYAKIKPPVEEIAEQERREATMAAMTSLEPHYLEAIEAKYGLGEVGSAKKLAQARGKTLQSVHKLAAKGIEMLQIPLARFG